MCICFESPTGRASSPSCFLNLLALRRPLISATISTTTVSNMTVSTRSIRVSVVSALVHVSTAQVTLALVHVSTAQVTLAQGCTKEGGRGGLA